MATQLDKIEKRLESLATDVAALTKLVEAAAPGARPAPPPVERVSVQGAPPREVMDFISQIMKPSEGADPAAVAASRANLARWAETHNAERHEGLSEIDADRLTPEDIVFMAHADEHAHFLFRKKGGASPPDVYQALLSGSNAAMARARDAFAHDHKDVLPHKQEYMADKAAWVAKYGSTPLEKAFHEFLREQGV